MKTDDFVRIVVLRVHLNSDEPSKVVV